MRAKILAAALLCIACSPALAQSPAPVVPLPTAITTGNTYQQLLPAGEKKSITIENNNATDNCLILFGGPFLASDTTATSRTINGQSLTAAKASILLLPGGAYTRYWPYIPSNIILGTCASTGDSLYVDIQ